MDSKYEILVSTIRAFQRIRILVRWRAWKKEEKHKQRGKGKTRRTQLLGNNKYEREGKNR